MSFDSSIVNAALGKDDKCVSCNQQVPRLSAAILFPNLGCPLVLASGQTRASIVIAVTSADARRFAVDDATGMAQAAHPYIDRHLRLYGIDKKETDADTSQGHLFGDGNGYEKARAALTTRRIDRIDAGRVATCRSGMAFSMSAAALQFYREFQGGSLFEIDIDLSVAPFTRIDSSAFHSFAWMVELTEAEKKAWPGKTGPKAAHYQDLLVNRFLGDLQRRRGQTIDPLHEFDVSTVTATRMDAPGTHHPHLQAWHPVIRAAAATLKLGHLSDVHVSVRHQALARSPVALIEDATGPEAGKLARKYAGDTLCNAFLHLKTLFEKMGEGRKPDTAVLLTGDLIDFNRNVDPRKVGESIGEQWKAFNILGNIHDAAVYPRWQDDMLVFSLVRHAYTRLKLPVFMTTGNHEAYETPYGISPRVGAWGMAMGGMEVGKSALGGSAAAALDARLQAHRKKLEEASAYAHKKANGGIAADHNLTLYEATLAYGPTYGQTWTGFNFDALNFDWFGALFNPLGDFVLGLGGKSGTADATQLVAGLAWGPEENYQNLGDAIPGVGVDAQGAMILPRAAGSFSAAQQTLLAHAQNLKAQTRAPLVVASHFTIFSYDQDKTLADPRAGMTPANAPSGNVASSTGLGPYNMGTCERNLKWYFDDLVLTAARPRVDWHLSGHSHRAGVYKAARATAHRGRVDVQSARDPGLDQGSQGKGLAHDGKATHFVVSSCGGPIGYQNLGNELKGWTLRPPAGSLVDTEKRTIKQVASNKGTGRPRLCVALDYLHLMWPDDPPLRFEGAKYAPQRLGGLMSETAAFSRPLQVILSDTFRALECVKGVRVWVCEMAEEKTSASGRPRPVWRCLEPVFGATGEGGTLSFTVADQATLAACLKPPQVKVRERTGEGYEVDRCAVQAFCEVTLKKPTIAKDHSDWSQDMNIEDNWLFPLELGVMRVKAGASGAYHLQDYLARPTGELGEVPDWKWLHDTWGRTPTRAGNKYPEPGAIIKGK